MELEERGAAESARTSRRRERPLTQEEVLRRNSVERIKAERHPFDVLGYLPTLAATSYEEIAEEEILRLQWYGLYHDKPKVGEFMLRVKLPNGELTAAQLDAVGRVSEEFGAGSGELTTRQDIQLHHIRLETLPQVLERLGEAGLNTAGGCGDNVRNITGCPVAGVDPDERFDVTPTIRELHGFFSGNRAYGNLPRKHKYTISACRCHCNAPEIHDIALVGVIQDGRAGYSYWVGGGLSSVPRIGRSLGVFVPTDEALEVSRGLTELWSEDLRYRMSRARARFKFMVDDDGPELLREKLETRLGWKLQDIQVEPAPEGRSDHLGIHAQRPGPDGVEMFWIGVPVFPGLITGVQMREVAALLPEGTLVRITREQNFLILNVPAAEVQRVVDRVRHVGFELNLNPMRGHSIGCTGDPHCNFAVGDTKPKLVEIVTHLENRFGERASDLRLYLDGCPHACGQHWVGDLGFQGTTRNSETGKIPSYDVIVRGKLGPDAAIGRPLLRRIPSQMVSGCTERLVETWLDEREPEEGLPEFYRRQPDERIQAIALGEAAETAP